MERLRQIGRDIGGVMFPRNCWYVVAWSQEIAGEALLERTILDESLLIWRRRDGSPVIMGNRCPHRHAPLAMGRREGDEIRCMYHGLKFDAEGRCTEIPGKDRIRDDMRTPSYPVVERGAWLWVWMGDAAEAAPAAIPDAFSLDHPDWRYKPGGYLRYDADYRLICDNLLDFSHLSYVHETTLGGSTDIAETRPAITSLERGIRVTRDIRNGPPPPYVVKLRGGPFAGPVDRLMAYDFLIPGILLMASRTKPSDTPDDDPTDAIRFHSCQALTPETARTTHYFFMQAHAFRLDDPSVSEGVYRSLCEAFEEDRRIIEAQQRLLDRGSPPSMQPINADAALGRFRWLLNKQIEAESRPASSP
jgi:vanillate O-demethylase monooxygenase subunit